MNDRRRRRTDAAIRPWRGGDAVAVKDKIGHHRTVGGYRCRRVSVAAQGATTGAAHTGVVIKGRHNVKAGSRAMIDLRHSRADAAIGTCRSGDGVVLNDKTGDDRTRCGNRRRGVSVAIQRTAAAAHAADVVAGIRGDGKTGGIAISNLDAGWIDIAAGSG